MKKSCNMQQFQSDGTGGSTVIIGMNTMDLHPARALAHMPLRQVQRVQNQIWAADMIMPIPEEPQKQSAAGRQGVANVQ